MRHLDDHQVDIYVSYESSEPISLRRYKEIWGNVMGIEYNKEYALFRNGERISNDDALISDNIFNDYEVQMDLNFNISTRPIE